MMDMAMIVPQILQKPKAIFRGMREDGDDDDAVDGMLCYCGVPTKSFRPNPSGGLARESAPFPGQVFLVFVNEENVAYMWRWEKADEYDPNLPKRWSSRFRERVLP